MADYSFTGWVFMSVEGLPIVGCDTYNTMYYCIARPSQIQNYAIYYQGYFHSGDTGVTPHTWSPVYTNGRKGEIDCNLGDEDWLGSSATIPSGSTVVFVFWEKIAGSDRTSPTVLHGKRGWIETETLTGDSMELLPLIAFTSITYSYWDNMPDRYGSLYQTYEFQYASNWHETYELPSFNWCRNIYPFRCTYTDGPITMSHEATKYGEQMFATIDSIKEILTFSNGDYIERTQSPVATDFTHKFDDFNSSKLIKTLEYEVDGVFYPDTLYPNSVWQDMIIKWYFATLTIKSPGIHDIHVYKDRDFKLRIHTDRVDYWTFKAQIKENTGVITVIADFDIDVNQSEEYLELFLDSDTTEALTDDITINASSTSTKRTLFWDLKFETPTGLVYNLVEGNCYIHKTVTKD